MTAPVDSWGPWAAGLDRVKLTARIRTLRAITHLSCGPRGDALCDLLRRAESDGTVLEAAALALSRLEPLDFRRILASYAAISRQNPDNRRSRPC